MMASQSEDSSLCTTRTDEALMALSSEQSEPAIKTVADPSKPLTNYTPRDILCGRGGLTNRHVGNRIYRRLIQHNKPIYQSLQNKQRQIFMIQSILKAVQSSGGRFLKKAGDHWVQLSDREAHEKVKQAIREPDSKYAATCSIRSDLTVSSSVQSSSVASASSSYKQKRKGGAELNFCVNPAHEEDLDNVSCFSDFTIDGPVAPLSRGTSTFLEEVNASNPDPSVPFARIDMGALSTPTPLRFPDTGANNYAQTGILIRKPKQRRLSLIDDNEESPMSKPQLPSQPQHPLNIPCSSNNVMASMMLPPSMQYHGMHPFVASHQNLQQQQQQQQQPLLQMSQDINAMLVAQKPLMPQICPCKVHQVNSDILAWNMQLQAFLEAQLQQGHAATPC